MLQSRCKWKWVFTICYVPFTSGSTFSSSRNLRIQCNSFLDIAHKVYKLFCCIYLGPHARLGCFFVHCLILYFGDIAGLYYLLCLKHQKIKVSVVFSKKKFVLMSKIEQVVVRKRNNTLTAFLFFWAPEFGSSYQNTSIKIQLDTLLLVWSRLI